MGKRGGVQFETVGQRHQQWTYVQQVADCFLLLKHGVGVLPELLLRRGAQAGFRHDHRVFVALQWQVEIRQSRFSSGDVLAPDRRER